MDPELHKLAVQYAMLARPDYTSFSFHGSPLENELVRLKQEMAVRFGEYRTKMAIEQAHDTLKMMNFHPESKG